MSSLQQLIHKYLIMMEKDYPFSRVGDRLITSVARSYDIKTTPMEEYCSGLDENDKLPRGMDIKILRLRLLVLDKIKSM